MYILGISAYYHDAAAVLLKDDEIIAAIQEERCSRIKGDAAFPVKAIKTCLEIANISIEQIDIVTFYDKPFLKFERILETFMEVAPKGFFSFCLSMPVWIKEKLFLKSILRKELKALGAIDLKKTKLLFTEHHLSHAASCYYTSPFQEAAIVTIDGVGEWATVSISHGKGADIEVKQEIRFPHSLGLLYSSFTYFLGFKVNSAEYKVMGLAPYAARYSDEVKKYYQLIKKNLVSVSEDGSFQLHVSYFSFQHALYMIPVGKWEKLFDIKKRDEKDKLTVLHASLAAALQMVTEEIILNICRKAKDLTGSVNLCLSGGLALNCVANSFIAASGIFDHVFIQPAAGDAGGALGAALATRYIYQRNEKTNKHSFQPYLGNNINHNELDILCKKEETFIGKFEEEELLNIVAKALADDKVIGWVQGRMEWGPRALGNRSILASALSDDMQGKINQNIKRREGFRPFAPVVIEEDADQYFDIKYPSPWMMFTFPLQKAIRKQLAQDFDSYSLKQKLLFSKSILPAITHVDFSARVQTVNAQQNKKLYLLLQAFKRETGKSVLVNTSFNVRGEPIVMTAKQAFDCFIKTDMDMLIIENRIFRK